MRLRYQKLQWPNSFKVRQKTRLSFSADTLLLSRSIEYLPAGMTCAKDAKDLVADCAKGQSRPRSQLLNPLLQGPTEFIVLVSSEAHEICEKGSKKTIAPEHIVEALKVSQ
jgi:hypothetical protein